MNEIVFTIAASAIALFLILLLMRFGYKRSIRQIWRALKSQSSGLVFTKDMVADLDERGMRG